MRVISNSIRRLNGKNSLEDQPCMRAIKRAKLPQSLRKEINAFIQRNILPDCGRVPPNCLKAHMIKTAKKLRLKEDKINSLKNLFKADIGYGGHYLDAGKLRKVRV
jgi:hypothetical protein